MLARRIACAASIVASATAWSAAPRPLPDTDRAAQAGSAGPVWSSKRFSYKAEGKRIADVLQDFAASQGLPLVMAEGVDCVVNGSFDTDPERFLGGVAKVCGIVWYHDGSALYVYPAQAVASRMIYLKGDIKRTQIQGLLDSMGLGDRRYPLRVGANESTLFVSGPPRHVELVTAAIEQLEAGASDRNRRSVRIVPLRFASAADRTFGQSRIAGLAATLNELFAAAGTGAGAGGKNEDTPAASGAGKARPLPSLLGTDRNLADLFTRRTGDTASAAAAPRPLAIAAAPARPVSRSSLDDDEPPIFRAEEGTNSILVFARQQRLPDYVDLIRRLDVKPMLVELEATIIDVSSDSVDSLGINWQLQSGHSSVGVTPPPVAGAAPFQLSTLWSNAGRELLARIDALSARGKASIVARPRVLGVANRPAVMRDQRTIAVKVSGSFDASLYQIEAGTLVQMTPYVISGDGETRIRLAIYIEDGNFEDSVVDGIPSTKRMEISTEAHALEGQSILIGGITTTADSSQLNGVPGLSRLPVVGSLFRTTSDRRQRSERMFLITPRLIRDGAVPPAPPALPTDPTAQ